MEKEVEQLKLTALNIRSVLTGGIANIKKIKLRRNEVDRKIEEKKKVKLRERVLESASNTRSNIGAATKNLASKFLASKPGGFFKLFLLGVLANSIGGIIDFFRSDTFKNLISGIKNIGKFFKSLYDGIVGFFNPQPDMNIPQEELDENYKELEKINDELKEIKQSANLLGDKSKELENEFNKFSNKSKTSVTPENNNKAIELETNVKKIDGKSSNIFDNKINESLSNNSNLKLNEENQLNNNFYKEVREPDLKVDRKKKTKVVVLRQPVIMGEK